MKKGSISVKDGSLYYRQSGSGESLILIHSMGLSSELWLPVMEPLAQNFSVYAVDLMGHGDSDKPDLNYETIDHAKRLVEFMDELGIKKARIIGSSIGAMIGIDMAVHFPEWVEKLVLVACPVFPSRWKCIEDLMWLASRYDSEGNPVPQTVEQMQFLYTNPTQEITDWTNDLKSRAGKWCKKDQIAIALWEGHRQLNAIHCPTLVLIGTEDVLIENEGALVKGIRGARSVHIPGVSHFPQKEDPQAFVSAVLDFL
jgi:pimeloyl-ACP methyl ester carboxylesterase